MSAQLDIFGEVEKQLTDAEKQRAERQQREAEFRALCLTDAGWQCPACGKVEANEFLLGNNHGYRAWLGPSYWGDPFGGWCGRIGRPACVGK